MFERYSLIWLYWCCQILQTSLDFVIFTTLAKLVDALCCIRPLIFYWWPTWYRNTQICFLDTLLCIWYSLYEQCLHQMQGAQNKITACMPELKMWIICRRISWIMLTRCVELTLFNIFFFRFLYCTNHMLIARRNKVVYIAFRANSITILWCIFKAASATQLK